MRSAIDILNAHNAVILPDGATIGRNAVQSYETALRMCERYSGRWAWFRRVFARLVTPEYQTYRVYINVMATEGRMIIDAEQAGRVVNTW